MYFMAISTKILIGLTKQVHGTITLNDHRVRLMFRTGAGHSANLRGKVRSKPTVKGLKISVIPNLNLNFRKNWRIKTVIFRRTGYNTTGEYVLPYP